MGRSDQEIIEEIGGMLQDDHLHRIGPEGYAEAKEILRRAIERADSYGRTEER
jgi:hypothetical protein